MVSKNTMYRHWHHGCIKMLLYSIKLLTLFIISIDHELQSVCVICVHFFASVRPSDIRTKGEVQLSANVFFVAGGWKATLLSGQLDIHDGIFFI